MKTPAIYLLLNYPRKDEKRTSYRPTLHFLAVVSDKKQTERVFNSHRVCCKRLQFPQVTTFYDVKWALCRFPFGTVERLCDSRHASRPPPARRPPPADVKTDVLNNTRQDPMNGDALSDRSLVMRSSWHRETLLSLFFWKFRKR